MNFYSDHVFYIACMLKRLKLSYKSLIKINIEKDPSEN